MTAGEAIAPRPTGLHSAFWRAWLAGAVVFALLAGLAAFFDYFPTDLRIASSIQSVDVPAWGGTVAFANQAGDTLWATVAWGVVLLGLLSLTRWRDAAFLFVAVLPRGVNALIKVIVSRPRPSSDLVHVTENATGFSFPSGHVTTALTFYVLLFVIAAIAVRQPIPRLTLQGFCVFMVLVIGPSRVYTGAHWPSDVLGGYMLSVLFLAPALRLYLREWPYQARRTRVLN